MQLRSSSRGVNSYRVLIIEWKDILIMIMSKEGVYIRVQWGRMRDVGTNRRSVSACSRLFCNLLIIINLQ